MTVVFYIAGAVAVVSTLLVITRRNTIHALLYLVVSLFAVAVVFYTLGAPFVAALEVIVYAGAIIVLFLFTVMLLNLGREAEAEERRRLRPANWIGPGILAAVLLVELGVAIASGATAQVGARAVEPREVGVALYGPYAIGVELASTLLLAALIGARHLGQRQRELDAVTPWRRRPAFGRRTRTGAGGPTKAVAGRRARTALPGSARRARRVGRGERRRGGRGARAGRERQVLAKGRRLMAHVPFEYGLYLAAALFLIGLVGVLVRRNLIFVLASIEIMLNAAGLAFVVAGSRWGQPDGQVMFIFILSMAAAEVAVGLALALLFRRSFGSLDIDEASRMRG